MAEIRRAGNERLEYICTMLAELRRMSGEGENATLSYLIEMAILEARELSARRNASGKDASGGAGEKRDAVA